MLLPISFFDNKFYFYSVAKKEKEFFTTESTEDTEAALPRRTKITE
jgi:hypothetical protein